MAAWKLGPALATGNTRRHQAGLDDVAGLLRIAELGAEAGIPDGVLNVVTGPGDIVGEAIGRHPGHRLRRVHRLDRGRPAFLHYAADTNLKRVLLELGGKSPQVVFADAADLEPVAANVAGAIFWNMGENCSAGSRLIVHRRVKDELARAVVGRSRELDRRRPAGPRRPRSARSSRAATWRRSSATSTSAATRAPGSSPAASGSSRRPAAGSSRRRSSTASRNDMRIAREEIFGPVLSVIEFETEAEAVAHRERHRSTAWRPRSTPQDLNVAHRVARELKAGIVGVNCLLRGRHDDAVRRLQAVRASAATTSRSTPTTSTPRRRRSGSSSPAADSAARTRPAEFGTLGPRLRAVQPDRRRASRVILLVEVRARADSHRQPLGRGSSTGEPALPGDPGDRRRLGGRRPRRDRASPRSPAPTRSPPRRRWPRSSRRRSPTGKTEPVGHAARASSSRSRSTRRHRPPRASRSPAAGSRTSPPARASC